MPTRPHDADRRSLPLTALCCAAMFSALFPLAACSDADNSASIRPGENDNSAFTGDPTKSINPASITIHPLTRIGSDASGAPAVLLYLDVKDRFGQSIKALGRVRAELFRPQSGTADNNPDADTSQRVQAQDRVWNLDLRDPDRNALMFDELITRTYTIPLGGLPDWLVEWSRGVGNTAPTLRIEFTFADRQGGETTLRAAQRLSR